MDDHKFLDKLQEKIERLTGTPIDLVVDEADTDRLEVDLLGPLPNVLIGSAVLQYPGFARMCVEYAVASIREGRKISVLEFHVVLGRN